SCWAPRVHEPERQDASSSARRSCRFSGSDLNASSRILSASLGLSVLIKRRLSAKTVAEVEVARSEDASAPAPLSCLSVGTGDPALPAEGGVTAFPNASASVLRGACAAPPVPPGVGPLRLCASDERVRVAR